jgi:S-(hydroxymethyl)glutathione dehydrogenase/alcohol dehydrogenase
VLVIGLGGVGLSVLQGARLAGVTTIVAVDRNTEKAELALAAGVTDFVPADEDTKKAVRGLTEKRGADFAFSCVGSSRIIRDMWSMTRRGGSCTIVGIDWVRAGELHLRPMVTGHGTLADLDSALDELAAGRGIRTLVRPGGGGS